LLSRHFGATLAQDPAEGALSQVRLRARTLMSVFKNIPATCSVWVPAITPIHFEGRRLGPRRSRLRRRPATESSALSVKSRGAQAFPPEHRLRKRNSFRETCLP
jgi:hypothetical protein